MRAARSIRRVYRNALKTDPVADFTGYVFVTMEVASFPLAHLAKHGFSALNTGYGVFSRFVKDCGQATYRVGLQDLVPPFSLSPAICNAKRPTSDVANQNELRRGIKLGGK